MPEVQKPDTAPTGAVQVREDFTGTEITAQGDLSAQAAAAEARTEIESRIIAAHKWPRDVDLFRRRLLNACRRPGFAATALYHKPVGRKKNEAGVYEQQFATNFSIRFIEEAIKEYGNMFIVSRITYDDERKIRVLVVSLDCERNSGYATDALIEKTVERRPENARKRVPIRIRENSYGDVVHIVEATPDEVKLMLASERSKLIRTNGQRLLPADILEECRAQIDATVADEHAKDPDAAKKKVIDRFNNIGINPAQLKEYMERPLDALTVKDIAELTALHTGLKDGDFTWADVMKAKNAPAEGEEGQQDKPEGTPGKNPLKDKLMSARETAQKKEPSAQIPLTEEKK
jgi:hypothetical protein